ncbi:MAG: uroporphyrinogen decarboxylase family protein [Spirochaetales bacterium]|nr:uroporphyrinogen decarboxylase family protein [Spirochaetales bacterium]
MTHKERILAAADHKPVDRVPTDMWATVEVQEKLFRHFGIEEGQGEHSPCIGLNGGPLSRGVSGILRLWDELGVDGILEVRPPCRKETVTTEEGVRVNEWGFGYRTSRYEEGSYDEQVLYPLAGISDPHELERYEWPDPDWYDYAALPGLIDQCGDRAICCGYSALFTFHNYLRGLEQSLMDPVLEEELTRIILQKVSDFFLEYHRRCFEAAEGRIHFSQVTDDWGAQTGLITSPEIFQSFYKEHMERAIALVKSFGIRVFHHDDGDMRPLLPELTEMGIDILNPVQWRCGDWDLKSMKETYGSRICFHSAVDNQETLPRGTAQEVGEQVRELVSVLASDRTGFILGPCHNLQPNTSVENILALYEAAKDIKWQE